MKHTIQAGIVSPFPMARDPQAVDFDDLQSRAIEGIYAIGGAALWDGESLSFETDPDKARDILGKFNEVWATSPTMAEITAIAKEAEAKAADDLVALLKEASKPGRGNVGEKLK